MKGRKDKEKLKNELEIKTSTVHETKSYKKISNTFSLSLAGTE